jgi:Phage protein (N4 Gp49/phage Sf6 gene 66) family
MTDQDIENEIQAKGLTAKRVTLESINAAIQDENYYHFGARVTICFLTMDNNYIVIGESACISSNNFDAELGRKIARQNAIDKLWALMGFHLAYAPAS